MSANYSGIFLPFKVGVSPTLGIRGIIATTNIEKGQVIERSPILLVNKSEEPALKQTVLWKYYYEWNSKYHCIALGYGSLFNHSYKPNAEYLFDFKYQFLTFKALRFIRTDEEITVNYNFEPKSRASLTPELLDFNRHFS
jgi:uncharacterized protein